MNDGFTGAEGRARQWNKDNQYDTNEIEKNDNNSQQTSAGVVEEGQQQKKELYHVVVPT